jgi:anti-sigma factor RsiW
LKWFAPTEREVREMRTTPNAPSCGYQEQLVAYLYDEAGAGERAEFERHLGECAACRDELRAFKGVRRELLAWEVPFTPPIEVTLPRGVREVLQELFSALPGWFKISTGLAATAAAALVIFALAGTRISVGSAGVSAEFGRQTARQTTPPQPAPTKQPESAPSEQALLRSEAEAMIAEAVSRAQAEADEKAKARLASLEARLGAAHRAELVAAINRLRGEHQKNLNALIAERQRPTINEWLFAANESQESAGADNEKND